MIKLKAETVHFDKAVPAPKMQVLLWLATGGRRGRLFEREKTEAIKYSPLPDQINCRCVMVPIIDSDLADAGEL